MTATPIPFSTKDNASGTLDATVTPAATSAVLESGDGANFPQPYAGTCTSLGSSVTLNSIGISAAVGGSAVLGKLIWNATDGSVAVITGISTDAITTTRLLNGSDNIWENSDVWRIDPFIGTLAKIATSTYGVQSDDDLEEVLITARSSDTVTLTTRGYNGTIAKQFDAGDELHLRVTSPFAERLKDIIAVIAIQVNTSITAINTILDQSSFYAVATGSSNAYAASYPNITGPLEAGMRFSFQANFACSAAATLTVTLAGSAQSAVTLKKQGNSTDVVPNDILNTQIVDVEYDGTYFQILSASGNNPSVNYRYGTGVDGALNVTSGTTTLDFNNLPVLTKNYTSVNIAVGATLAFTNVPASGGLFIMLSQGNVTIAGTINLSGKGSTGGAAVTVTRTSNGLSFTNGNPATAPYNTAGQGRIGTGGTADHTRNVGAGADSSGGCGGSNAVNSASSTAAAGSAAADLAGSAVTAAIAAMSGPAGILVGPGAGGDSGAVTLNIISGYASGTFTATSGSGGIGGGGLYIACGGNFSFTGTINLSGTAAGSDTFTTGSATNYGASVGGSGGGAAGTGKADVAGTITNSGTVTATGGALSTGDSANNGGGTAAKSDGTNGVSGTFVVTQSY